MRRLPGTSRKAVLLPLVLTTAIHLGILLLAVAAPKLIPEQLRIPEVYQVELYSAPPAPPEPPVPQPPQSALHQTPRLDTPPPVASLPKARVKANLSPPSLPPPARAKAISLTPLKERLARENREREEADLNRQLTERMTRLRLDLQEQKAAEQARAATRRAREAIAEAYRIAPTRPAQVFAESPARNPATNTPGPNTSTGTNPPSAKQLEAQAAYIARLKNHLRRHWKLPVLQDWDEKLSATMLIRIKRDGSVLSTGFEKHSANPRFDQYVKKAVDQSSPLPALPKEFEQKSEEIAVTFTPGGLK